MKVMRVETSEEATYEVRGLTEDQAATLAALADFPLWSRQPESVREFCAALHSSIDSAIPWVAGFPLRADAHGMTPDTTV